MSDTMTSIDKARELLRQLFRTENADLEFGIYRIMNSKRSEIDRFIDKDLIAAAQTEFKAFAGAGAAELEKELNERKKEINEFVPNTIGEDWAVLNNQSLPKVIEFVQVLEAYQAVKVTEEQVQDVFNHVYEFFSRYYDGGDFIPLTRYGGRDKYYIPYNGEEVFLHWATKDMYYVKTGEYFTKYAFKVGKIRVTFKLVEVQVEQGNVKGERRFFSIHDEDSVEFNKKSNEIEIKFNYRGLTEDEIEEYTRQTHRKIQESLVDKAMKKIWSSPVFSSLSGETKSHVKDKSLIRKHLDVYVERNTKDFFISEDLKGFLSKELEFYLKNEVFDLNILETSSESRFNLTKAKARAIRGISNKIIEFLSQIEEFQKRLFTKKKFVLRTDYCMTLDMVPKQFYEEIANNIEMIADWSVQFGLDELKGKKKIELEYLNKNGHLVLDTTFFPEDFKNRLIGTFENLSETTDGLLIKSGNYHALNLLLSSFEEKAGVIYIDPPFNTGTDEFLYKDRYQHSSWLTMMSERLKLAKQILNPAGTIYVHIDYNENMRLRLLLDDIFGSNNFLNEVIYSYRIQGIALRFWPRKHQAIYLYKKTDNYLFNPEKEKVIYERPFIDTQVEVPNISLSENDKKILKKAIDEQTVFPDKYKDLLFNKYYSEVYVRDVWDHDSTKPFISGSNEFFKFRTQKSEGFMKRIITSSTNPRDIVLDFFLGSGTTIATAHKLDRKWIGIEMGDHFEKIIIPRMKEVLAGSGKKEPIGISKEIAWKGGGFFKYQYIEQYEDSLNNIEFVQSDGTIQSRLDRLPDYFLSYMLDYETKDSPTRVSYEQFKTPFDYRIRTLSGGEEVDQPVDLVETFNYLLGLTIGRLRVFNDGDRFYRVAYGKRGFEQLVVIWRNTVGLDLKRDKEFIDKTVLVDTDPDTIYINGDSYLQDARPIEPEFRRLMGA